MQLEIEAQLLSTLQPDKTLWLFYSKVTSSYLVEVNRRRLSGRIMLGNPIDLFKFGLFRDHSVLRAIRSAQKEPPRSYPPSTLDLLAKSDPFIGLEQEMIQMGEEQLKKSHISKRAKIVCLALRHLIWYQNQFGATPNEVRQGLRDVDLNSYSEGTQYLASLRTTSALRIP